MTTNTLYYGDNLVWLRDHQYFPNESIDLIYLDPPFNSKADYNVLFNEPGKGGKSQAQVKAFDDTWDWSSEASEVALNGLANNRPQIAEFISWLSRQGKPQESMAAYLSMMAIRLMELHRVLKSSGSIYLHCDSTASHYLKLMIDMVFGAENFQNEIIWRRTGTHGKSRRYAPVHDIVLFYTKSDSFTWTYPTKPYMKKHVEAYFIQDEHGYRTNYYGNVLTGSGLRKGEGDTGQFPVKY
ncbi:MAG: site-specific DNA-methyltransferase [Chloroflexi bacterium]|nr:site-specific DNA-methyltransferase [Chloroflexota bacterium]